MSEPGDVAVAPRGLAVREQGPVDAPVVVLVHGSMDRSSGMRRAARALADDLRVVIYDRRGYGRSAAVGPPFSVDEQVADLMAVIDGRPAVVFGHSFGGDIALAAAERHPHLVRAVGTYEAPMSWEPWWPEDTAGGDAVRVGEEDGPAAAAEAFGRRMVGDRIWDRLPPATRADRLAEGPALVGELSDLRRRPPYDPALITVPVLVARGERCAAHHLDGTRTLIERLILRPGGRVCEAVVVPGVGHGIHLDQPAAMAGLVRRVVAMAAVADARGRPSGSVDVDLEPEEVAASGRAGRGGVALHAGHAVLEVRPLRPHEHPEPHEDGHAQHLDGDGPGQHGDDDPDEQQPDDQQHAQRGHLLGVQGAQHRAILGGPAGDGQGYGAAR